MVWDRQLWILFLAILLAIISPRIFAANNGDITVVNVSGVILDTPACSINNDRTIKVSFGYVAVNKVDSGEFRQPIPYDISCEQGDVSGVALKLSLTGISADFDSDDATLVSAEQSDLGIKIYQNGVPFKINEPLDISINSIPSLEAVLVQRAGANLEKGDFSATATLKAVYQ
ncbi:fimbrial protein [Klebsiella oxytoca]|uniref:Fimbrial protein n=1 Tax=Klebsiella oxytoca TaxID=571 RepID=A0A6B8MTC1_KLEOX|nr:fimbrial protein [Klebsiella oxytoca]QGN39752.1 fimbrial protein [Klebsiella oxytoca]